MPRHPEPDVLFSRLLSAGISDMLKQWRNSSVDLDYERHASDGSSTSLSAAPIEPVRAYANRSAKIFNVLFLCAGNSDRSIMAESMLNGLGNERLRAFSAGTHATGNVHPLALELIRLNRLSTENLRSKGLDEFTAQQAPQFDFVFSLCERTSATANLKLPGRPISMHWGVEDPTAIDGSTADKRRAFFNTWHVLSNRIRLFAELPVEHLEGQPLLERLRKIASVRNVIAI